MVGLMGWGVNEKGWRKGPWTPEEDKFLTEYVSLHGEGRWSSVARCAGLNRSGKSCRLRWVNYLRPGLKKCQITPQEEGIIIELHALWGNKWSTIARYLPGRTDNEIKNYWRTHFKKKPKLFEKQVKQKAEALLQKQQQQQQENDINKISPPADVKMTEPQDKQEVVLMYPTIEQQCWPVMYQDVASWLDTVTEDGLWDGLWNLDDPHGCPNQASGCSKPAIQSQSTAYNSYGAATNNLYNDEYIL